MVGEKGNRYWRRLIRSVARVLRMEGLEVLNCMVRVDCWDSAVLWFSGVTVVRGRVWIGADVYWF